MDIVAFLKLGIKELGTNKHLKGKRAKENKARRTSLRNKVCDEKRNINNLTPTTVETQVMLKKETRIEKLLKWKKEKDERLAREKAAKVNVKPIFKVSSYINTLSLNAAMSTIKGKEIAKKVSSQIYQFANPGYAFNFKTTSSSMKPRNEKIELKRSTSVQKAIVPYERTMTRSRKQLFDTKTPSKSIKKGKDTKLDEETTKSTKNAEKMKKSTPNNKARKSDKYRSTEEKKKPKLSITSSKKYLKVFKAITKKDSKEKKHVDKELLKNESMFKGSEVTDISNAMPMNSKSPAQPVQKILTLPTTPENQTLPVSYISPFVTMSRGKDRARNEYKHRSSRGGLSETSPENTGSKAGAAYFRNLLDTEIARIEEVCKEWNLYEENENPIEEACDMIHVAIGQSTLLVTKRMNQFRGLIDKCEQQNSDPLITCKDLHGFWDVLLIQVHNLNKRFENLARLKETNWEEVYPDVKAVVTRKRGQAAPKPAKKATKASSSIKDAIKAARKKAADKRANVGVTNISAESEPKSARKSIRNGAENSTPALILKHQFKVHKTPLKTPIGRKSMLQSVLSAQTNRRTTLSPCIAMMRVSTVEKQLNLAVTEATPSKSILKLNSKSTQKKGKSVVFIEDASNAKPTSFSLINDENDLNVLNNGEVIEVRRSNRTKLLKTKLF